MEAVAATPEILRTISPVNGSVSVERPLATEAAFSIGDRIETGTWFMNRCDDLDPALTWTGVKPFGRGVGLSVLGYEPLTRPKSF